MARLELQAVAHRYAQRSSLGTRASTQEAARYALAPLDLVFREGGAYALLGPSGCGKSTLLNIISGLLRPSEGRLLIDGKDVTAAPPQARNIAQVFQFPVIYDTMTVADNLAFPLRNRGVDRRTIQQRVAQIADLLELTPTLGKRASSLSADMKQRISLGRGLVRTDVAAILLDEPLTVIDPHVKWLLRRKLLQIHAELAVTLIYVTHDQTEALTLADQVLVMSDGCVLQQGTPEALFERPEHTFVGYFIGSPGMNLLPCTLVDGAVLIEGQRLPIAPDLAKRAAAQSEPLVLGVRPEFVRLHASPPDDGANTLAGRLNGVIDEVETGGHARTVFASVGGSRLAIKVTDDGVPAVPGARCSLELLPERTILYAGGRAL